MVVYVIVVVVVIQKSPIIRTLFFLKKIKVLPLTIGLTPLLS